MVDLWTFQPWPVLRERMIAEGSWSPSFTEVADWNRAIGDDWWERVEPAYRWVVGEMERAGIVKPFEDSAPVWAWLQWVDDRGRVRHRPDPSDEDWDPSMYEGCDLIHLRVDASRVLATRFDEYHAVVNGWPLAPDGLEGEALDELLDAHWDDPRAVKEAQWRVGVPVPVLAPPATWVQATVWSIRRGDVVGVVHLT